MNEVQPPCHTSLSLHTHRKWAACCTNLGGGERLGLFPSELCVPVQHFALSCPGTPENLTRPHTSDRSRTIHLAVLHYMILVMVLCYCMVLEEWVPVSPYIYPVFSPDDDHLPLMFEFEKLMHGGCYNTNFCHPRPTQDQCFSQLLLHYYNCGDVSEGTYGNVQLNGLIASLKLLS